MTSQTFDHQRKIHKPKGPVLSSRKKRPIATHRRVAGPSRTCLRHVSLGQNRCMGLDWSNQYISELPGGYVTTKSLPGQNCMNRARPVQTAYHKGCPKRRPVFPFSGFDLYHHFRNDAFHGLYNLLKVQKTEKRAVVLGQPFPQTLYCLHGRIRELTSPKISRVVGAIFMFQNSPMSIARCKRTCDESGVLHYAAADIFEQETSKHRSNKPPPPWR